jgi:hypothetical protein
MPFADDLLDLAGRIASLDGENPQQASLRRAVSTAYYALFHLMIAEATANWSQPELRPLLGRIFEHGKMKQACEKIASGKPKIPPLEARTLEDHLRGVARGFIEAYERREEADYDVSRQWSWQEVVSLIESVEDTFQSWQAIRDTPAGQEFLVMLLGPRQRRRPA